MYVRLHGVYLRLALLEPEEDEERMEKGEKQEALLDDRAEDGTEELLDSAELRPHNELIPLSE